MIVYLVYASGSVAYRNANQYGQGTGPILMSNVGCTGTESRVLDCSYYPFHECTHSYDVGIKCEGKCNCISKWHE